MLALLLAAAALFRRGAFVLRDMIGSSFSVDAPVMVRLRFIHYVDDCPWMVAIYIAVFFACLLWFQFRQLPCWAFRLAFALLALPIVCYVWVCLRVMTEPVHLHLLE